MRKEDDIRFHKGLPLEICPIRSKLSIVISVGKSLLLLVCVEMMRFTTLGVLWLLSRGPHVSPLYLCRPHHHETFPMTEFQISSPRRTTVSSIESGLSGIPKARSFEIILSLVMIASPFFLIATIFPTDEFMGHVKSFEEAKLVRFIKK
jgi:hypothetical protein